MASRSARVAGAWVIKPEYVRIAGAWVSKPRYVRVAGAWVFIGNHTTSITPSPVTGTGARPGTITTSATATPSGGTGPFTYLWSSQSGGVNITLTSTTLATCNQESTSVAGAIDQNNTDVLQCVVTDTGNGNYQTTTTVDVSHLHVGNA